MLVKKMADGDDGGGRRSDGYVGGYCDSSVGGLGVGRIIGTCRWVIWCTYSKSLTSHPFIVSLNVSFICRTYMLLLVTLKRQMVY